MKAKSARSATEKKSETPTNERSYLLDLGDIIHKGPFVDPPIQAYYSLDGVAVGVSWMGLIHVYVSESGARQRTERKGRLVLSLIDARRLAVALTQAADECDAGIAAHDTEKALAKINRDKVRGSA